MKSVAELLGSTIGLFTRRFGAETAMATLGRGTYTVIDWTDPSVSGQEVTVRDGLVKIVRKFHAPWPGFASPSATPAQAGHWLRQQLDQAGISAVNAVVCVPRRSVSLRLLEFPMVEDDELAALVMLQLESRVELLTDDRVYDYLPLPFMKNAEKRHVLLATMPRAKCEEIVETMKASGLTLRASGVGELAVDALTDVQTSGLTLNVLANHAKVEFVLSHGGAPLASHSTRMPDEDRQQFASTISNVAARMVAALPASLSQIRLMRINLMGPHADALLLGAKQQADCEVRRVATGSDDAIRTLALTKCLSVSTDTVNFQSPRRPADSRRVRKQQLARVAVGAVVLAALTGYCIFDKQAQLRQQVAVLQETGRGLEELSQRGEATIEAWKFVDNWQNSTVAWSDELHTFSAELPETGKGYLTQMQLEQSGQTQLPMIRVNGLARDADIALDINRKLMGIEGKYELQPHGIEPATRDADFQAAFRVEAGIRNPGTRPKRSGN
ncbi:MAG: hypothetical protein ABGZ17_27335 [Planctomycetaceae bacterium]